jgi:hypothetical protein
VVDGDHEGVTTAFHATTSPPDAQPRPDSPVRPHHDVGSQVTDRLDTLLVDLATDARWDAGSGRPDSIGQEVDPEDGVHLLAGRHRAAPSPVGRAARTATWGSAGLLVAALLGWAAAAMLGLTGPADLASGAAGLAGAFPVERVDPADRTFERTVEVSGRGARHSDETPTSAPGTPVDEPAPASGPVMRPSSPGPSVVPAPTPIPVVSAGDPCPAEGDTGVTEAGRTAVCTASRGNGKTRWRHA